MILAIVILLIGLMLTGHALGVIGGFLIAVGILGIGCRVVFWMLPAETQRQMTEYTEQLKALRRAESRFRRLDGLATATATADANGSWLWFLWIPAVLLVAWVGASHFAPALHAYYAIHPVVSKNSNDVIGDAQTGSSLTHQD
jgi:hypothetical protein